MRRPTRVLLAIVTVILAATAAGCSSSSSTSSTPSSGAGAGNPSKETFCALLVAFRAANDSLDADVNSGDAARSEAAVKRLVSQAKTLQDRAPTDIRADVEVAVTHPHQLALGGPRGGDEHVGQRRPVYDQRVVSSRRERARETREDALPFVLDRRRTAVHQALRADDVPAEHGAIAW